MRTGVWLFAAGTEGLVHEYIYNTTTKAWRAGFTFPTSDGFSGAYASRLNSYMIVTLVNSTRHISQWGRARNNGTWELVTDDSNGVSDYNATLAVNTSICAPNNIFFQDSRALINVCGFLNVGDSASLSRWYPTYNVSTAAALQGTGIGCQHLDEPSPMFRIFYQNDNGEVVEATRMYQASEPSTQTKDYGLYDYRVVSFT